MSPTATRRGEKDPALDRRPLKRLRPAFRAIPHLALLLDRHALLTIRNLTAGNTDRMFNHERDYSEENSFARNARESIGEKNSDQRKIEEKLDHPSVVPRIRARILRERKRVGVCTRGAVLCDYRRDLSLANSCSRRRATGIFPTRADLRLKTRGSRGT